MLNHVSIGVPSLTKAKAFYDATLSVLGFRCLSQDAASLGYGDETVEFWVLKVEKPSVQKITPGLHICFTAATRDDVNRFHAAGLGHGGRDNGPPGPRPDYGPDYYAAYLIDPDGYRVEAYYAQEASK
jgi:catechol 2,3-dioxygenase-like lactoylglutathione lyase family enzyme